MEDQRTNLYVQIPINNRKAGQLCWCLNNPDSCKIQQMLTAVILGKFLNYKNVSIKAKRMYCFFLWANCFRFR